MTPREKAEEIADWAIDEKLVPIRKRCADMIEAALVEARAEQREIDAKIVEDLCGACIGEYTGRGCAIAASIRTRGAE
jgi:hypothetical protein